jgi:hypothetical protein
MLGQLHAQSKPGGCVIKMKSDCVTRENLRSDPHLAQKKPGIDDSGNRHHKEPKRWETNDVLTKTEVLCVTGIVRKDQEKSQEESHNDPPRKAMYQLEIVVVFGAECRIRDDDDSQKQQ